MPDTDEIITLFATGSIPGIPGEHSSGTYLVSYQDRTCIPVASISLSETDTSTVLVSNQDSSSSLIAGDSSSEAAHNLPEKESIMPNAL